MAGIRTSIAESVYNDVVTRSNKYYYFIGKTLDWYLPNSPEQPTDSVQYDNDVKNGIVLVKEIRPSDIAFIAPRRDWEAGTVYDQYDDAYSDRLIGVDILQGGENYSSGTTITVSGGLSPSGVGAVVTPIFEALRLIRVDVVYSGYGYISSPTITINDPLNQGSGAVIQPVMARATSGANTLVSSNFYVLTDDFNIYKCLDNNNGVPSLIKPTGTVSDPIRLSDGYLWKFIGYIPPALRTRFLTIDSMPVYRALTNNFYSRGELKSVTILSRGNNYTSAIATVSGDGYLESNPVDIAAASISSSGSGYSSANVVFEPPVSVTTNWLPSISVFGGVILEYNRNIYEVVIGGVTGNVGPVHTFGTVSNGATGLKYRGTRLSGNVSLSGGGVNSITLDGIVNKVTLSGIGSGYTYPPAVALTGGGGSGAQAYSVLTPIGNISKIIISASGSNYTSAPTVTIGTEWVANARVYANDQLFYSSRLYTVTTDSGNLYTQLGSVAPVHTSGNVISGNATLTYAGIPATGTSSLRYGYGYNTPPKANIIGDGAGANATVIGNKTSAELSIVLDNGQVSGVSINDGGIGYSDAAISVTGDGTGAELVPNLSQGDLLTVQASNELLSIDGAIYKVMMISKGYNYTQANTSIQIYGDGTGATATANVIGGRVNEITITNPGLGYSQANVVIIDTSITPTGRGALARCILPPPGGHGRDVVNEIYAKSISLFTNITSERNQGFTVTNDYRQFGIIKNIRNYDNNRYYNSATGSACWSVISSSPVSVNIIKDTILTSSRNNGRFLVIDLNGNNLLLSSIDGIIIEAGDVLSLGGSYAFSIDSVIPPETDKYSGELLYVENRTPFSTVNQILSFKTVFNF